MPAATAASSTVWLPAQSMTWPVLPMVMRYVFMARPSRCRRMASRRRRAYRAELREVPGDGREARQRVAVDREPDSRFLAQHHSAVDVVIGHRHAMARL